MYLIDTSVISEIRKRSRANSGVRAFFAHLSKESSEPVYVSAVTIGELRRGVELLRHRRDDEQAARLEAWLEDLVLSYQDNVLDFSEAEAQVWGKLRVPRHENALDKQIAATALTHGLTLVTRNTADFQRMGLDLLNPFDPR